MHAHETLLELDKLKRSFHQAWNVILIQSGRFAPVLKASVVEPAELSPEAHRALEENSMVGLLRARTLYQELAKRDPEGYPATSPATARVNGSGMFPWLEDDPANLRRIAPETQERIDELSQVHPGAAQAGKIIID